MSLRRQPTRQDGCGYRYRVISEARQHVPQRTAEPDDADAHAPLHPPDEAFSKKVENHTYAVALHMMYYNFVRIHQKLRATPAMAVAVADKLWEIGDIAKLVEDAKEPPKKRGQYKARASA